MILLSIDIGLENLALTVYDTNLKKFTYCNIIDIRAMTLECPYNNCPLYHEKTFSDYVDHLIHYNKDLFENANVILIEQQPPGFGQIIEQLIFSKYRNKCPYPLMSPTGMHCYFYINHLEYESRKERTVQIAEPYLKNFDNFINNERKHDLADSVCYVLHYLCKEKVKEMERENDEIIKENNKIYLENKEKLKTNLSKFIYKE